ncbi:MAG: Ca2+-transporting ATPase [Erysipelotrichaceae bacterium]|nr:MAG: Ca2+-transporting [Erysipelotrichaceae bacterium]TXT18200.1 MAG: Ca2+-transporting ATPase [Erysipelotrichaceae bacterium]
MSKQVKWHEKKLIDVLSEIDVQQGLNSDQVLKSRQDNGENQLDEGKKKSFFILLLEQFNNAMILILIAAAVISGFLGEVTDAMIIMAIVILNALLGILQENKAEKALAALKEMSAPMAKVRRNAQETIIPSKDVVVGDILMLEAGDKVAADVRLIKTSSTQIQESSLTGESVPVDKSAELILSENASLGDRKNMAYASSNVTYGRATGLVIGVGMDTEVGKIAKMLTGTPNEQTPLQKKLDHLGKVLGVGAVVSVVLIFVIGLINQREILELFLTSVSLAVAVIPESLPAVATIVMAMGVQRMAKRNAIIRNLSSVETLGGATIICSDKTGTLTQNKMTVTDYWISHEDNLRELRKGAFLCNDARLIDGSWVGDPTETALSEWAIKSDMDQQMIEESYPRVAEVPFDSGRKKMTTVHQVEDKFIAYIKGGVDEILAGVTHIASGSQKRPITDEDRQNIQNANEDMGRRALRVLALAKRELNEVIKDGDQSVEAHMTFVGLMGMIDPPREEVKVAIEECRSAGIRPIMITGDHKTTAEAIGRQIGLMLEGDRVVTGNELDEMSDQDLFDQVKQIVVYARVSPEHKMRIIDAWKKHGEIVAMTGDGVNDAPALKKSDIGAAMGIVGTEVAKGASDMVLADDNFATVVHAVEEGRRIRDNISKAISYLLSCNVGELSVLLIATILNWDSPLLPIHILWINLVTDSLPALALGVDPAQSGIMKRLPNRDTSLLNKSMVYRISYQGLMIGGLTIFAYLYGSGGLWIEGSLELGRSMAFSVLAFSQLAHSYNIHSNSKSVVGSFFINKWLIGATVINVGMMMAVLFIPGVNTLFKVVPIDFEHWEVIIALSLMPIVVVEVAKLLKLNGK